MPSAKAVVVSLFLATLSVPATLAAQSTNGAVPGTLNFIRGQANIDGQPISTKDSLAHPEQLRPGQTLATANGSADILLAPGALLRLGQDTTVRMVAANAGRSEVRLEQGLANVSVNVVRHDDLLLVDLPNGQTQLLSHGLYTFNGADNTLRVFHGEADAFPGADTTTDIKPVKVKEGHLLVLDGDRRKAEGFDRELADTDLLPWTGPRESQAALASVSPVHEASYGSYGGYAGSGFGYGYPGYGFYPGGYGFGDPYFADAGFGYPWGPYGLYGYPFFGVGFGYFGGGFYGGGSHYGYGPGGYPLKGPGRPGFGGMSRGSYAGHAFAGGGLRGGGFGGGGFHGGGFSGGGFGGGGFHGGGGHR